MKRLSTAYLVLLCVLISRLLFAKTHHPHIAESAISNQQFSNNKEQTLSLEAINTIATLKGYETSSQTIVTDNEIGLQQSSNLKEIFKNDPSISVGGGSNVGQKIYIRGFESLMMRVTIDGAAQNGNAFHHQGSLLIDPSLIKRITVSKGMAQASIGPGALKGAIEFETKNASDFLKPNQKFGTEIAGGFFTNFGYKVNTNVYARLFKDVGVLLSFNHQNILNYRDAKHVYQDFLNPHKDNTVLGSNSMQNNILLKVGGQIDDHQGFSVGYMNIYDTATRPYRSDIGSSASYLTNASQIFHHINQNSNLHVNYEYVPSNQIMPKIKITAYNNTKNVNLTPLNVTTDNSVIDSEGIVKRAIVLDNYGGAMQFSHQFQKHLLEYGFDYQGMKVRDDNMAESEKNQIIDGISVSNRGVENAHIVGGFIQDTWDILSSLKWSYGTRYDIYYYFDKNSHHQLTQGFSPSTALTYTILNGFDIGIKYAFVTRGATPGDATLLRETAAQVAPNLRAEYSNHVELNIDYINDFMSLNIAAYYGNILHYINSYANNGHNHATIPGQPHIHESVRNNVDFPIINYGFEIGSRFYYYGFELGLSAARNWLTAGGSGNGALLADTYELGATWGYSFILQLKYEAQKFDIAWLSRFVTGFRKGTQGYDIYNHEFMDIGREGYSVSDLHISYYPIGRDKLTLRFSIYNIFNAYYIDPTSPLKIEANSDFHEAANVIRAALYEPGTDYRIEIRYRF